MARREYLTEGDTSGLPLDIHQITPALLRETFLREMEGTRSVPPDTDDPIAHYKFHAGRYKLLTRESEQRLFKIRDEARALPKDDPAHRNKRAAEQIVTITNLRLVIPIARSYASDRDGIINLIQEGNVGLFRAIEKFDRRKGFKFSTYATGWILQSVSAGAAQEWHSFHFSRNAVDQLKLLQRVRGTLRDDLGREPLMQELVDATGLPEDRINTLLFASQRPISLDMPLSDELDSDTLHTLVPDTQESPEERATKTVTAENIVLSLLDVLTDRERAVVELLYGLDTGAERTLQEVGDDFNLTRERIRQIRDKAILKMREGATRSGINSSILVDI